MTREVANPESGIRSSHPITLALLTGLGFLLVAQIYMDRHLAPAQAMVLFLLALALVWAALGKQPLPLLESTGPRPRPYGLVRAAWVVVPGAVFVLISAGYAWGQKQAEDGVLLWLVGLGIFLLSLVLYHMPPRREWRLPHLPPRAGLISRTLPSLMLVGIMALALYLRVFDLKTIPPFVHDDEAAYGLESRDLADGKLKAIFINNWGAQPMMTALPGAIVMKLWDDNLGALRLANALMGVASLPFLYLFARLFVGSPAALLAVFLLAVSKVDIHFSRQGMNNIQVVPLTVIAMYFLTRAMRRQSMGDAFVCGIAGGMALYSYFSGRIIPFVVGSVLIVMILTNLRRWRSFVALGAAILIAALLVFGPMMGYYLADSRRMLGYQSAKSWWNNMSHVTGGDASMTKSTVLARQIERSFWGFNYFFDTAAQFGAQASLLDTITAILMFIGLAISLRYWRDPGYFSLIAWSFWTPFFMGVLAVGPPHSLRLCALVPGQCVLAAIAVQSITNALKKHGRVPSLLTATAAFVLVPGLVLGINYNQYFNVWAVSHRGEPQTELARHLAVAAQGAQTFGLGTELDLEMRIVKLLAPNAVGRRMRYWDEYLPMRALPQGDALFVGMDYHAPDIALLREYYPDGELAEQRTANGRVLFATYRLSAESILGTKGLIGRYSSQGAGASLSRSDDALDLDWGVSKPAELGSAFDVTWDGSLLAPEYGSYSLAVQGGGEAVLTLDGNVVVRKSATQVSATAPIVLAKGWHVLRLELKAASGSIKLLWQRPGKQQTDAITREFYSTFALNRGLFAQYYSGTSAAGTPAVEAIEPVVFSTLSTYADHQGSGKPFTGRWTGTLTIPASGRYTIGVRAHVGTARLTLDSQKVLDFGPEVFTRQDVKLDLQAGAHTIELIFVCPIGRFDRVELWWAPPGQQEMTPLPGSVLTPAKP